MFHEASGQVNSLFLDQPAGKTDYVFLNLLKKEGNELILIHQTQINAASVKIRFSKDGKLLSLLKRSSKRKHVEIELDVY